MAGDVNSITESIDVIVSSMEKQIHMLYSDCRNLADSLAGQRAEQRGSGAQPADTRPQSLVSRLLSLREELHDLANEVERSRVALNGKTAPVKHPEQWQPRTTNDYS